MGRGALKTPWAATDHVWFRNALSQVEVKHLQNVGGGDARAGQRLGPERAIVSALDPVARAIAAQFAGYYPVRLVSFTKSNDTNWQVPWHQDRVIAVKDRAHIAGYSNWSKKGGDWHCEPPVDILDDMLFVRVFLDRCDADNGGMEFARGSHAAGLVASDLAAQTAQAYDCDVEVAAAGDILVLPMLSLHRSRPTVSPNGRRRVLRLDFARSDLPTPLEWMDYGGPA